MRRVAFVLAAASVACALPACRGVLGIDTLELVEGGADATAEAAGDGSANGEAGGNDGNGNADTAPEAQPDSPATIDASEGGAAADASDGGQAGDASGDVEQGLDASDASDARDAPDASDSASANDASDSASDVPDASPQPDATTEAGPDASDSGAPDVLPDAIVACVNQGANCRPCCHTSFPNANDQMNSLAVTAGCICGSAQCASECSSSVCADPSNPGTVPANCYMCFDQALFPMPPSQPTQACGNSVQQCLNTSTCQAFMQCMQACAPPDGGP